MGMVIGLCHRLYTRELGPQVYDRKGGAVIREKDPLLAWLLNEIVYSWPMDIMDRFHLIRSWLKRQSYRARQTHTKFVSSLKIPAFVDFYEIQMDDFVQDNPSSFRNFNDFFIREIRTDRRPIANADDDNIVTSAGDCRLTVFDTMRQARRLFIKGGNLSLEALLGSHLCRVRPDLLTRFNDDSHVANCRLHPMDYHRFHAPVSGDITLVEHILGEYYTVKSKALHSDVNVLCENTRTVVLLETMDNGAVLFIPIGAEDVGTVTLSVGEGAKVNKGDEIGMFQFGGSDILLVFERPVDWDRDLKEWSSKGVETLVRANERIGEFSA